MIFYDLRKDLTEYEIKFIDIDNLKEIQRKTKTNV